MIKRIFPSSYHSFQNHHWIQFLLSPQFHCNIRFHGIRHMHSYKRDHCYDIWLNSSRTDFSMIDCHCNGLRSQVHKEPESKIIGQYQILKKAIGSHRKILNKLFSKYFQNTSKQFTKYYSHLFSHNCFQAILFEFSFSFSRINCCIQ